ncbi:SdiA-regulated domain-containing protein [Flavobacteriaceae bacterium 14752]|uniref:SdiA-regulated domain-containing protein n=1 Tax=Mesohalobacter salilacus TaxID=2491711 RepID=UPI000F62C44D|nr:hypothetical protein EIG84_10350 [Flavobacteriaceae bacterium 14752]
MFKNLLGLKIIIFLCVALISTLLIFKDVILGKEQEKYQYKLTKEWILPNELNEISGMVHWDKHRLICVQDEDGYLFVYNLKTKSIEKRIKFGPGGDYESVTKVNETVYVLRSDGKLFEINNVFGEKAVKTYQPKLKEKYNFEGLHYDSAQNRLLLAPKFKLKKDKNTKPIFGFDLANQKFIDKPIYQLNLNDKIFKNHPEFMPSALTVNPRNEDFYMLDGRHMRLLILDSAFNPKTIYKLNEAELPQAEGLAFYKDKLYISTESDQGVAQHIYEIELKP